MLAFAAQNQVRLMQHTPPRAFQTSPMPLPPMGAPPSYKAQACRQPLTARFYRFYPTLAADTSVRRTVPGRWNHQRADARQRSSIPNGFRIGTDVLKALSALPADDARALPRYVMQTGDLRGIMRIRYYGPNSDQAHIRGIVRNTLLFLTTRSPVPSEGAPRTKLLRRYCSLANAMFAQCSYSFQRRLTSF